MTSRISALFLYLSAGHHAGHGWFRVPGMLARVQRSPPLFVLLLGLCTLLFFMFLEPSLTQTVLTLMIYHDHPKAPSRSYLSELRVLNRGRE